MGSCASFKTRLKCNPEKIFYQSLDTLSFGCYSPLIDNVNKRGNKMATVKHFSGDTELKNVFGLDVAKFKSIGGVASKHNRFDSFQRLVGYTKEGDAVMPVTRTIFRKANASNHKCSDRCRSATGHDCECECGGEFHGIDA